MQELQLRLQEPETTVQVAAEGLTENERLCAELREVEAQIKKLETLRDDYRDQVRSLCEDGELVGGESTGGYYTLQDSKPRRSFDWEAAARSGLFTESQAEPFFKVTTPKPSLVFKPVKP